MKKILLFQFVVLLFMTNHVLAQVTTNFNNENVISSRGKFLKDYRQNIDFTIPTKSIDSLLSIERRELTQSTEVKPFRLAAPIKINLDIVKLANWTYDKDFAYGKFTIKLSGALSSSISFDKFYLPENTELFVYNESGKMITGPVTEKENNQNKVWGSWVYQGDLITIEIKTPTASISDLILHSDNIAYGYKEIYKSIKVGGFGQSGSCNINVICPLGNGWEEERNSVSTILSADGDEFCTGSLIMNTCGTNVPYYLTANHCFDGNTSGWRFAFQAWSTTCPNPGVNTNGVIYNGSTLRARNAASDFCLVELNTTPPANSGLHYAGWTRSATPAQNATAIHHPRGDLMKISQANNPVSIDSYGGSTNQHWRADWSPQNNGNGQIVTPITEPGSSGSPLFDQNHRIIGQLHGGPSACGASQLWDFYGRFDLSWTGGGTNASRLSNWLDPDNTGTMTTNTSNTSNLIARAVLEISGPSNFCTSESYSVNDLPPGATVTNWSASPSGYVNISSSGNTATVTKVADGLVTLTATINTACGTQPVTREITVGNPPYPYGELIPIGETNAVSGTYYSYYIPDDYPGAISYTWDIIGGGNTPPDVYYHSPTSVDIMFSAEGDYSLQVEITTGCGIVLSQWLDVYVTDYGYYAYSPNPADNELAIEYKNNKSNEKPDKKQEKKQFEVSLMDDKGRVLRSSKNNHESNKVIFNTLDIQNGVYYLHIKDEKEVIKKQIIIKH